MAYHFIKPVIKDQFLLKLHYYLKISIINSVINLIMIAIIIIIIIIVKDHFNSKAKITVNFIKNFIYYLTERV